MKPRSHEPRRARIVIAKPDEPLLLLHLAFRAIVAEPDALLAELELTRVHHRILFFVARARHLRVLDLAATLGVSKQALHGPLQQLVEKKLVLSQPGAHNLRERRLSLSAPGKALERRLSGPQRRAFRAVFAAAGAPATLGWHTVMQKLARAASTTP